MTWIGWRPLKEFLAKMEAGNVSLILSKAISPLSIMTNVSEIIYELDLSNFLGKSSDVWFYMHRVSYFIIRYV